MGVCSKGHPNCFVFFHTSELNGRAYIDHSQREAFQQITDEATERYLCQVREAQMDVDLNAGLGGAK
jgi:hypothetical protein